MLYVSVLLASFTIRFYLLSRFFYTYTHTRIYSPLLSRTIVLFLFLPISSFLTFALSHVLSSFSHDILTIDYATSWQICVVLATVSYSRTRRLSPIANYIRFLLHLGESRVPRGFPIPAGRSGLARGMRGGKDRLHEPQSCKTRLPVMCDSRIGAMKLFELARDDDDDSSPLSPFISFSLYVYPLISD